jgi:hypothetical protein
MTTYTQFVPQPNTLFQFQPTLDGQQYTVVVTWSLYGQRWYFNLLTLQRQLVLSAALVGSPDNYDIDLVWGYFTTSRMIFRASTQQFEVSP